MNTLRKYINIYNNIEKWFLIIMMALMVVIIFAQVVTRYVFGNSLFWSEEIGKFIFVWISWIGVSAGMVNHEHIQITIVLDILKKKGFIHAQKFMELVGNIAWMVTSFIILVYGMELITTQMNSAIVAAATGIPMWIVYLCLPISSVLVCARLIGVIYMNIHDMVKGGETA